jgi:hypothetical protein
MKSSKWKGGFEQGMQALERTAVRAIRRPVVAALFARSLNELGREGDNIDMMRLLGVFCVQQTGRATFA